jgi:hypothetical protein
MLFTPFIEAPNKCMYDSNSLLQILTDLGFDGGSKAAFDISIPDIKKIELESRTNNAVIIEANKL